MKVANKSIIRKLTVRFLKAGRTRNIIAVIAIALTSVMFTCVFTLGGNMLSTIQNQTMRQVGSSAHGGFKYLTKEQYENFAQSRLFKDISYRKLLASAENEVLSKEYTEISYIEDKNAKWHFAYPSAGDMPRVINEAAASTIVLDALGVPYEIGAEFPLEFTVRGVKYREMFTLCGYWDGDPAMPAQMVWVSEEYVDSVISGYDPESDFIAGAVNADVWFGNSFNVENKLLRLIAERGYADGEINYGVNWAYVMSASGELDPAMVVIVALALTLILLSGYLIIYSVFAISVKTDIHFYGLLKTVGATGTQLRRIVRGQAFMLAALGIPFGLSLGYVSGVWLTPLILSITSYGIAARLNSANPLIFVFAAAFSLLTVFIGCRRPGKIAARVSPVEAVKYSGASDGGSLKKVKKTRKVAPLSMAWANVTREKRKLSVIVLSLSLALILLNGAFSASRSFDMEEYLSLYVASDFSVADNSINNVSTVDKNTEGITREFLEELENRGITAYGCVYFYGDVYHELSAPARENFARQFVDERPLLERHYGYTIPAFERVLLDGRLPLQIYGLGQVPLETFYPGYEKLASGDYVLTFGYPDTIMVYDEGDKITLANAAGERREFAVLSAVLGDGGYPYSLYVGYSFIPGETVVMADNVFRDFYGITDAMQVNFNVAEESVPETENWIAAYTTSVKPALAYTSRAKYLAEFEGLQTTYFTIGGAMSFILALIGVLNFINTVIASIIARRRELAMLQSVGMTGVQLRATLFFEGLCYTALTLLFTFTAGVGLSWLIVRVMAGQVWFFKEYLTVMPSVYCVLPLFLICALVPLVCYKGLTRESLVERLRLE